MQVECLLWQALLHISKTASGDTLNVLKSTFEKIDMMLGEDIDVNVIDWFDPGKSFSTICMKWRVKRYAGHREEEASNGNGSDTNGNGSNTNGNGSNANGNTASRNIGSNEENQAATTAPPPTVTPIQKPGKWLNTKRRLEDQKSQHELNLETARQICVDGKMYELVNLAKEEVQKSM